MVYSFRCSICNEEFDVVQQMNIKHEAFHCGIEARRVWGVNTDKDLAYSFTTDMFGGKPVVVTSKRQFKTLLKSNGMADASIKECSQEAKFRKRVNEQTYSEKRKSVAKEIFSKHRDLLKFRIRR